MEYRKLRQRLTQRVLVLCPKKSGRLTSTVTLYTNHGCPWAHRAHITLHALKIPYEEVIIPLDRPRDPWYLDINPRGLVPSIKLEGGDFKGDVVTESAVVSQFLADSFPSQNFLPASNGDLGAALKRARIQFFVDTWLTKVGGFFMPMLTADDGPAQDELAGKMVEAIKKEIEPLLEGSAPFFGGSKEITFAEVIDDHSHSIKYRSLTFDMEALTAPFIIRTRTYCEHGLAPLSLLKELDALPNFGRWSKAVCAEESVDYVFDAPSIAKSSAERIAKMKADKKQ